MGRRHHPVATPRTHPPTHPAADALLKHITDTASALVEKESSKSGRPASSDNAMNVTHRARVAELEALLASYTAEAGQWSKVSARYLTPNPSSPGGGKGGASDLLAEDDDAAADAAALAECLEKFPLAGALDAELKDGLDDALLKLDAIAAGLRSTSASLTAAGETTAAASRTMRATAFAALALPSAPEGTKQLLREAVAAGVATAPGMEGAEPPPGVSSTAMANVRRIMATVEAGQALVSPTKTPRRPVGGGVGSAMKGKSTGKR